MLDMISILLNLLRFDLWPKMYSILENVPCALEVFSSAFGWNVLKISRRSISFNVSSKTCVYLLIFCLADLSIGVSGVLKSPTIIVVLSVSPSISPSLCLMYWGAPTLGASVQFSSVQSLSRVRLFATPWTAARQAFLSITISRSSLRLTSIESVMPCNHLILGHPLLLLPSIFPSIRVFSKESALCVR